MSSIGRDLDVDANALDGLTVRSTARGEPFTTACDDAGNVTLDSNSRPAAFSKTIDEFSESLLSGELYIVDDDEWRSALEVVGGAQQ